MTTLRTTEFKLIIIMAANNQNTLAQVNRNLDTLTQFVTAIQKVNTQTEDPEILMRTFRAHYDGAVVRFIRNSVGIACPKDVNAPEDCVISNDLKVHNLGGNVYRANKNQLVPGAHTSRFGMSSKVVQWYFVGKDSITCEKENKNNSRAVQEACRCCKCRDNRATLFLSQSLRRREPQYCTWVREEVTGYGLFKKKPVMAVISATIAQEIISLMSDSYMITGWDEGSFLMHWERLCGVVNNDFTMDASEKTFTRLFVRDFCQCRKQRLGACVELEN